MFEFRVSEIVQILLLKSRTSKNTRLTYGGKTLRHLAPCFDESSFALGVKMLLAC